MFNGAMMGMNPGVSLADIAAVTRNNDNNDGWGGNGGWWWIILWAMMWGWGGNGWGGYGNNGAGAAYAGESVIQRAMDTQSIIQKLDGINNGICSLGYDQLAQQNATNNLITSTGYGIERAIQADTIANMQNQFALSRQISDCCCDQRAATKDLQYAMAQNDCSIKNLLQQLFQQLMWGQQSNFRDLTQLIETKFCDLTMAQKDETIAALRQQLNNCDRDGALNQLYLRLTANLNPNPVPAYPACNPHGVGNWAPQVLSGNGYSNGCGCGSNWNNGCGCG